MGGGNGQDRRRVGQAALIEVQAQQIEEGLQLRFIELVTAQVGAGEVADQVELRDLGGAAQAPVPATQVVRGETQAVHARIQLEPDAQGPRQFGSEQGLGLFRPLHHQVQPELGGQLVLGRFEAAFQQQHPRLVIQGADLGGLFQAGHGKAVCLAVQTADHLAHAMTVGIRLDHREGVAAGRAALGQGVVMTDGGKVDGGDQRTH
ncbi:hypothetical protein D3C76_1070790 [compost metagenome]